MEKFRQTLNDNCTLTEEDMIPKIVIDVPMPISYINEELVEQLSILEPFGKETPSLFCPEKSSCFKSGNIWKDSEYSEAAAEGPVRCCMDGLYWGEAKEFAVLPGLMRPFVTYYPMINSYMGRESLQIVIQNYC